MPTSRSYQQPTLSYFIWGGSIPTPIYAARWLGDGILIRPSSKIMRLICGLNLVPSLGGSNFNLHRGYLVCW